jgi:hypothetical protein
MDLALYDRDGRLAAVVEVKNKVGTSREWAAKLRRNIVAHGRFGAVDFFLLVTPDRLYLWKDTGGEPTPVDPTCEIDARPLLQPYFGKSEMKRADVSGSAFELIVAAWLADLVRSTGSRESVAGQQPWLVESGFLDAVRNGRVEYQAAA